MRHAFFAHLLQLYEAYEMSHLKFSGFLFSHKTATKKHAVHKISNAAFGDDESNNRLRKSL